MNYPSLKNSDSKTRPSLLSRARLRDEAAWQELVALYGPLIAYWCRRCGLSSHATADCIQDVFTTVSRSLHSFRPHRDTGSFRGWLWTIAGSRIKDSKRRDGRHVSPQGGSKAHHELEQIADFDSIPTEEPSSSVAIHELLGRAMDQVRCEFEPKTWEIFLRTVVDQIPTAGVAMQFSITPAAVRQVRCRVLRRLREQLGDLEPSEPEA